MSESKLISRLSQIGRSHIRVKNIKNRTASSAKWLQRQLNDPYFQLSKKEGYRSRAAYKLIEIQEKYEILKPGQRVLDLGAAPGGWSQVASQYINSNSKKGKILALDLLNIDPIQNVTILQKDFTDPNILEVVKQILDGKVDLILSDMAPSTSGDQTTDHLRILNLCEVVLEAAKVMLQENGHIVMKIFSGGASTSLLRELKSSFKLVKHFKPNSSSKESKEMFIIAKFFRRSDIC